jgi:hypothetical protein
MRMRDDEEGNDWKMQIWGAVGSRKRGELMDIYRVE